MLAVLACGLEKDTSAILANYRRLLPTLCNKFIYLLNV